MVLAAGPRSPYPPFAQRFPPFLRVCGSPPGRPEPPLCARFSTLFEIPTRLPVLPPNFRNPHFARRFPPFLGSPVDFRVARSCGIGYPPLCATLSIPFGGSLTSYVPSKIATPRFAQRFLPFFGKSVVLPPDCRNPPFAQFFPPFLEAFWIIFEGKNRSKHR